MLNNKRITILADTIVGDAKIASFGAILDTVTMELSLTSRHVDKEACKVHRDTVRADQHEFEDYAYALQDVLKA
jgi:hypothetical protein